MVYLGLDLGSKTLGLAISDRTATIATSLTVLRYNNYDELLNELDSIVYTRSVDAFVLGNPLNLDGSLSKRSIETLEFKKLLESRYKTKEIIMQDERLSTVEAERMLISNDTKRKNRKKDKNGKKKEYRILLDIEDTTKGVNYVIYTDDKKNSDGDVRAFAATYVLSEKGNMTKLKPVENEDEFDFIEKVLDSLETNN